jgi:hypothetical protein
VVEADRRLITAADFTRNSSGSLAKFNAMRRASSLVSGLPDQRAGKAKQETENQNWNQINYAPARRAVASRSSSAMIESTLSRSAGLSAFVSATEGKLFSLMSPLTDHAHFTPLRSMDRMVIKGPPLFSFTVSPVLNALFLGISASLSLSTLFGMEFVRENVCAALPVVSRQQS